MDVARPFRVIDSEAMGMRQVEATDEVLFLRVAEGDQAAYRQLVGRHAARQQAFARRFLGNDADAEEAVQELFIKIWREAPRWEAGRAKFTTWLYRVMANLCIDRKRRAPPPMSSDIPDLPDGALLADGMLMAGEQQQRLHQLLATLPERQRLAITLCYFDELSNREAAEVLDVNVRALESLLSRGRATLKKHLQADDEEETDDRP